MYQQVIQQALSDCKGVANISDDIIVHGKTTEGHDERLKRVLEKLKEKNLTLNAEKCKFHMTKLVFMGLCRGKRPAECFGSRSLLGLANYNTQFIPVFSKVAGPVRNLTKKGGVFQVWR